jgi:bud site selection protein 20
VLRSTPHILSTQQRLILILNSDLDQIRADLESSKHLSQYKLTKANEDLPGLGEFYCVECAKWFEGEHNLVAHRKGKNHKRR